MQLLVDKRMYVRTYRRTFETGFIRSTFSKSRPNKELKPHLITSYELWPGNRTGLLWKK